MWPQLHILLYGVELKIKNSNQSLHAKHFVVGQQVLYDQ